MFNPFKCRHKRTYQVVNDMAVNTYCSKCDKCIYATIEPVKEVKEVDPWMFNGKAHKWVGSDDAFGNRIVSTYGYQVDEEHPVTIEYRRLEKLRHQGMLLEKVPEKYLMVEIDKKYITKGAYMFDGKGDLIKMGMHE